MGFQTPRDNKVEDDKEPICTNVDSSPRKTDTHQVLLDIPINFDFSSDLKKLMLLSSELNYNESCVVPGLHKLTSEQDRRMQILRRFSSFVVSATGFLALLYDICSSLIPLPKQHNYRLSIWPSLLGLFGFMVFVCAVAVMILVGAVFTPMQKATLIIWLVLMHLQSANSILEVCVILLAGFFMAWYAFWKRESPNNESDINESNMLM